VIDGSSKKDLIVTARPGIEWRGWQGADSKCVRKRSGRKIPLTGEESQVIFPIKNKIERLSYQGCEYRPWTSSVPPQEHDLPAVSLVLRHDQYIGCFA
jgi:hypothetical protein